MKSRRYIRLYTIPFCGVNKVVRGCFENGQSKIMRLFGIVADSIGFSSKFILSDFKTCPLSMCQFFFYLIHKIDWDFTWIMIQSWSIHVGANQLWGSLRPFLNVLMNVWHCHTSIKPSNGFKGALQVWIAPKYGSNINGKKICFKVAEYLVDFQVSFYNFISFFILFLPYLSPKK